MHQNCFHTDIAVFSSINSKRRDPKGSRFFVTLLQSVSERGYFAGASAALLCYCSCLMLRFSCLRALPVNVRSRSGQRCSRSPRGDLRVRFTVRLIATLPPQGYAALIAHAAPRQKLALSSSAYIPASRHTVQPFSHTGLILCGGDTPLVK